MKTVLKNDPEVIVFSTAYLSLRVSEVPGGLLPTLICVLPCSVLFTANIMMFQGVIILSDSDSL